MVLARIPDAPFEFDSARGNALPSLIHEARMLTYTGLRPAEAADEVLGKTTLDDKARDYLVRVGFITEVSQDLAADRGYPEPAADDLEAIARYRARFQVKGKRLGDLLITVRFVAADGTVKDFLHLTDADLIAEIARCDSYIAGYTAQRAAFALAAEMVAEHGVKRVRDLPLNALAQVREAVRKAWK